VPFEWVGIGALALIGVAFLLLHRIWAFVAAGATVAAAFASVTLPSLAPERVADWILLAAGLIGSICGLAIVRVMLVRSVSLHLLARLDGIRDDSFRDNIGDRLRDLRRFQLVRCTTDGLNALTAFGQLIAGLVAVAYRTLRIEA
jgi:hypothetical protein